ncbi:MAG: glycosyltransferase family 2 protein [Chitinophagaceae bacterium]
MNSRLVSIVLCTYNGTLYIDDQLNSILRQTYDNIEIIISDDLSTDGTFEKLTEYAGQDNRIKLFRNEKNLGYNQNFSKACGLATGNYIAIADQDDVWEHDKIEILLPEISGNEGVVLVHSISAKFETRDKPKLRNLKLMHSFNGNDIRQVFIRNPIPGHNMLFKRSLLEAALPFPVNIYYDWWLTATACCMGNIKAVNKILVWQRIHTTNATGKAKPAQPFYEQAQQILPILLRLDGLKTADKKFGEQLLSYYTGFPVKSFSPELFLFLLRHANIVFSYKKRPVPWLSYIKAAFIFSSRKLTV